MFKPIVVRYLDGLTSNPTISMFISAKPARKYKHFFYMVFSRSMYFFKIFSKYIFFLNLLIQLSKKKFEIDEK